MIGMMLKIFNFNEENKILVPISSANNLVIDAIRDKLEADFSLGCTSENF